MWQSLEQKIRNISQTSTVITGNLTKMEISIPRTEFKIKFSKNLTIKHFAHQNNLKYDENTEPIRKSKYNQYIKIPFIVRSESQVQKQIKLKTCINTMKSNANWWLPSPYELEFQILSGNFHLGIWNVQLSLQSEYSCIKSNTPKMNGEKIDTKHWQSFCTSSS